ncbi:hypothetical protein JCM10908_003541 [Rhodotorula pacifica]|uniref:DUF6534 domain-containing protein n=1 Tax=Rhodotorula pacifica TaxID=1495444 RepID=UPI00316ED293
MDVQGLIGPVLVGSFLGWATCGVVLCLAAQYWSRFSNDKVWLKAGVVLGVVLTVVDTIVGMHWAYKWGVVSWTNPLLLLERPWELPALPVTIGLTVFAFQHFYIYRVFTISGRNWYLAVPLSLLTITSCANALYLAVLVATNSKLAVIAEMKTKIWAWFAPVMAADILITLAMYYFLVVRMKGNLASTSSSIFQKIAMRTAQTNALSAICHITLCCLFAVAPTSFSWFYIATLEVKIYVASYIATLNARSSYDGSGSFDDADTANSRPRAIRCVDGDFNGFAK